MLLPSARSPSLIHSITPHFLRSPSSPLALWLSVSRLHTVLASHPAFLFPRWWKIIFRNGLRCWQSKVIWFMSRQQLDYDGMVTPPNTLASFIIYILPSPNSLSLSHSFHLPHCFLWKRWRYGRHIHYKSHWLVQIYIVNACITNAGVSKHALLYSKLCFINILVIYIHTHKKQLVYLMQVTLDAIAGELWIAKSYSKTYSIFIIC